MKNQCYMILRHGMTIFLIVIPSSLSGFVARHDNMSYRSMLHDMSVMSYRPLLPWHIVMSYHLVLHDNLMIVMPCLTWWASSGNCHTVLCSMTMVAYVVPSLFCAWQWVVLSFPSCNCHTLSRNGHGTSCSCHSHLVILVQSVCLWIGLHFFICILFKHCKNFQIVCNLLFLYPQFSVVWSLGCFNH